MSTTLPGIAAPPSYFDLSRAPVHEERPDGATPIPIGDGFRPGGVGNDPWVIAALLDDGRIEIRQARDGAPNQVRWVEPWEIDSLLMFDSAKVLRHPQLGPTDGWTGIGLVPRDGSARAYELMGERVLRTRKQAVRETLQHRPPAPVFHHGPNAAANLARLAARSAYVVDEEDRKNVATDGAGEGPIGEVAEEVAAAMAHLQARFGWEGWDGAGGVMRVEVNRKGEHARADALRNGTLVFGPIGYARDPSIVMHELVHVVIGHLLGSYVPEHVRHLDLMSAGELRKMIEASSVDEGFADVLGAAYARSWKIGGLVAGGPIRDIATGKGIDTNLAHVRAKLERDPRRYDPHRGGGVVSRAAWHMSRAKEPGRLGWEAIEELYFRAIPEMGRTDAPAFTFDAAGQALARTAASLFGERSPRHRTVLRSLARAGISTAAC